MGINAINVFTSLNLTIIIRVFTSVNINSSFGRHVLIEGIL